MGAGRQIGHMSPDAIDYCTAPIWADLSRSPTAIARATDVTDVVDAVLHCCVAPNSNV